MKIIAILFVIIVIAVVIVQVYFVFGQRNIETYPYEVKKKYEHFEIRGLELPDDELVEYLKEISFEMNLISKSKEIYRLGVSWFSNFLFHSCTFNQTNLTNKERYFPPYN